MPAYVYAPDVQSSYLYAAVAARMARVLATYTAPPRRRAYRASALQGDGYGPKATAPSVRRTGTWAKLSAEVTDDRNLAATEVYTLTGDKHWHDVFLEDTSLKAVPVVPFYGSLERRDAAFCLCTSAREARRPRAEGRRRPRPTGRRRRRSGLPAEQRLGHRLRRPRQASVFGLLQHPARGRVACCAPST